MKNLIFGAVLVFIGFGCLAIALFPIGIPVILIGLGMLGKGILDMIGGGAKLAVKMATTKECPYCTTRIANNASVCPHCQQAQPAE